MPRSCFRSLAAFVLILTLVAPWAVAGEPQFRPSSRASSEAATAGFFSSLWHFLTALWSEAGCSADPNGLNLGGTAASDTDAGCRLDPNGQCLPGS